MRVFWRGEDMIGGEGESFPTRRFLVELFLLGGKLILENRL